MSRTVWKFPLPISDHAHQVRIPGYMPCHVAMQDGVPTLWSEVEPSYEGEWNMSLQWFGTGHAIPEDAVYVGTVQDGTLVFHLYEVAFSNGGT